MHTEDIFLCRHHAINEGNEYVALSSQNASREMSHVTSFLPGSDGDVDGMTGRPMNLRISSQQKA
jgi:hypothetical protein